MASGLSGNKISTLGFWASNVQMCKCVPVARHLRYEHRRNALGVEAVVMCRMTRTNPRGRSRPVFVEEWAERLARRAASGLKLALAGRH